MIVTVCHWVGHRSRRPHWRPPRSSSYEGHLIVPSVNDSRIYCFAPGGTRTGVD
jgi:hypothetical protein